MKASKREEIMKEIVKRNGNSCPFCGKAMFKRDMTLEHQMPKCRGGTNLPSNLTVTCFECNQKKSFLSSYEFMLGMRAYEKDGKKYGKIRMSRNWKSDESNVLVPILP